MMQLELRAWCTEVAVPAVLYSVRLVGLFCLYVQAPGVQPDLLAGLNLLACVGCCLSLRRVDWVAELLLLLASLVVLALSWARSLVDPGATAGGGDHGLLLALRNQVMLSLAANVVLALAFRIASSPRGRRRHASGQAAAAAGLVGAGVVAPGERGAEAGPWETVSTAAGRIQVGHQMQDRGEAAARQLLAAAAGIREPLVVRIAAADEAVPPPQRQQQYQQQQSQQHQRHQSVPQLQQRQQGPLGQPGASGASNRSCRGNRQGPAGGGGREADATDWPPALPPYRPFLRHRSIYIKIPWAEPEHISPDFRERLSELTAVRGVQLANVYVRRACVEMVMVLNEPRRSAGDTGVGGIPSSSSATAAAIAAACGRSPLAALPPAPRATELQAASVVEALGLMDAASFGRGVKTRTSSMKGKYIQAAASSPREVQSAAVAAVRPRSLSAAGGDVGGEGGSRRLSQVFFQHGDLLAPHADEPLARSRVRRRADGPWEDPTAAPPGASWRVAVHPRLLLLPPPSPPPPPSASPSASPPSTATPNHSLSLHPLPEVKSTVKMDSAEPSGGVAGATAPPAAATITATPNTFSGPASTQQDPISGREPASSTAATTTTTTTTAPTSSPTAATTTTTAPTSTSTARQVFRVEVTLEGHAATAPGRQPPAVAPILGVLVRSNDEHLAAQLVDLADIQGADPTVAGEGRLRAPDGQPGSRGIVSYAFGIELLALPRRPGVVMVELTLSADSGVAPHSGRRFIVPLLAVDNPRVAEELATATDGAQPQQALDGLLYDMGTWVAAASSVAAIWAAPISAASTSVASRDHVSTGPCSGRGKLHRRRSVMAEEPALGMPDQGCVKGLADRGDKGIGSSGGDCKDSDLLPLGVDRSGLAAHLRSYATAAGWAVTADWIAAAERLQPMQPAAPRSASSKLSGNGR